MIVDSALFQHELWYTQAISPSKRGPVDSTQFVDFGALAHSEVKAEVDAALAQILESEQFRRSQRSRLFLQAIVRKALAGDFGSLKERILGIELFRRAPSFDTDRDAVVRVAANDVRNRLQEFYRSNPGIRIQISLPAGHYVPTIEVRGEASPAPPKTVGETTPPASTEAQIAPPKTELPQIATPPERAVAPAHVVKRPFVLMIVTATAIVAILTLGISYFRTNHDSQPGSLSGIAALPPWSQLIKPNKHLDIVLADANLVAATVMMNKNIPIEEYASHKFNYLPNVQSQFGAYLNQIPLTTVSDAAIATRITELVAHAGSGVQVLYSNRLDISALKGEEPLLLVGSATSNPWVQLFNDRLNFQIVHKFDSGMDICINRRPKSGELASYIPERNPAGVSEGYALIALVPNLTGKAKVLIIAGTSTEATEAAGEFVVNLNELSAALKSQAISDAHPQHLEFLIKTSFVSGSAAKSEVLASRVE